MQLREIQVRRASILTTDPPTPAGVREVVVIGEDGTEIEVPVMHLSFKVEASRGFRGYAQLGVAGQLVHFPVDER